MNKLLWMQCFVRAVETGNFSAVAREMGIGQPNISRHIASLERVLETRLIHRSTRHLTVTPEGQRYYVQARGALDAIAQAESDMRGDKNPQGLLRVSCSAALGAEKIMAALPDFLARYPGLELEFRFGDDYVDLVAGGIDIAIRGGALKDSALRARRVGTSERIFVASAQYLEQHGAPQEPADLLQHECIIYTLMASGQGAWPLKDGDVHVTGRLRMNSLDGIREAMMNGLGVAYLPSWMVADQLRSGAAQAVLASHAPSRSPLNAVYAAERRLPQRAEVFVEFVAALFAATPGLDGTSLA